MDMRSEEQSRTLEREMRREGHGEKMKVEVEVLGDDGGFRRMMAWTMRGAGVMRQA